MNGDLKMEMPTPCERCNELFDLLDGRSSPRANYGLVICESCADKEKAEIEREEEIESLREQISEAEHTLLYAKERLRELGENIH